MKAPRLTAILFLLGTTSGCHVRKTTIFLDQSWNHDYAKLECDTYERNYGAACIKTPKQIATELRLRLASAVQSSRACQNVAISYEPGGEDNLQNYSDGWSLTLHVGIDNRDIDYSHSAWSMLDNKTHKRFDGPFTDSLEAATQICRVANSRGKSVSD